MKKYLQWVVSVALLTWLAVQTDWAEVRQHFAQLRLGWWLAAVVLYLLTQVLSGQRWRLLARPLGFDGSAARFTAFVYVGMFTNLFLPASVGGDVVKALYLDGGSGRRLLALATVVIDRFSGLAVLLAQACLAVLLCPIVLPARVHLFVWGSAAAALAGLAALPVLKRLGQRFARTRRLLEAARAYRGRPRLVLEATGLAAGVQAANVAVVWLIGQALAAPVPGAYYWVLVPMVSLLVMVPVSVNGMGVREGALMLFLVPLGVAPGTALSLAWLWFAVFTATGLVGGVVSLCLGPRPTADGRPPIAEEGADHGPVGRDSDQGRAGQPRAAA